MIQKFNKVIDYAVVITFSMLLFLPVLIVVTSAFKYDRDIFTPQPTIFFSPHFGNFVSVIQNTDFVNALITSITVTAGAIVLTLLVSLPAAYAYSRGQAKGLQQTAIILLAVRMFPPIVVAIPLWPIFLSIGLIDTPFVLILIHAAFQVSVTTLLLKVFIDAIPVELEEAALIDGCTHFQMVIRIILPLITPGMFAASIYVALASWNDYLFAFLFTAFEAKTLPLIVSDVQSDVDRSVRLWGELFAVASLQLIPILIFIWVVQKKLLTSFVVGAVKG